jgi:hypothetical protein
MHWNASLDSNLQPFQTLMHTRLEETLGQYLGAIQEALPPEA